MQASRGILRLRTLSGDNLGVLLRASYDSLSFSTVETPIGFVGLKASSDYGS